MCGVDSAGSCECSNKTSELAMRVRLFHEQLSNCQLLYKDCLPCGHLVTRFREPLGPPGQRHSTCDSQPVGRITTAGGVVGSVL
jgi:hypothetical protein